MRLIVFFDLPMESQIDLKNYRLFRRFLIKNGFLMMQKSVYSRLVLNGNSAQLLKKQISENIPKSGLIQLLQVTEKQYTSIEYLVGKSKTNIINSIDKVVEI